MTLVLASSAGNVLVWIVWFAAALACVGSGIAVVSFSNPFYSALALIGNLASLAVLYLLLSAEFVAAAQVLVYAGAVMVMFLFVIAYLGGRADAPWAGRPEPEPRGAVGRRRRSSSRCSSRSGSRQATPRTRRSISGSFGCPAEIGRLFLTDHLLAFEITSVVLLIAAVGGVVLGAHARRLPDEAPPTHVDESQVEIPAAEGPDVTWYLGVAAFMFATGALGVLLRRSPLIVLLSLELMLNGGNLALIAFSRQHGNGSGQIFALSVMAVAASEVVVGLGLIVAMARRNLTLDVDKLTSLRG